MSKILQTVTEVSIHPERTSPTYGEMVTRVTLSDEGGGYFVTISQNQEGTGEVKLEYNELEYVLKVASELLEGVSND